MDYVDGSLARSKKLTSKFGGILDTVSDHFFSSLLFFLISIKVDSILHLYFLIIFLSVSWSQVYINTLIKYYKNNINKKKLFIRIIKIKKIQSNENLSLFKNLFQKLLSIFTFISINLNLITLLIFLYLNLLDEFSIFLYLQIFLDYIKYNSYFKNNYNFLNTKDYE